MQCSTQSCLINVCVFPRVELDMLWLQQGLSLPWSERIPKVFFRGRDSNKVRLDFVSKYRKKTDLFNVTLTQFFFHPHDEELYGKMVNRISFIEFFKVSEKMGKN